MDEKLERDPHLEAWAVYQRVLDERRPEVERIFERARAREERWRRCVAWLRRVLGVGS